jgi:coenzyme F420-reducing hydrogenase gamma subunit
MKPKIAVFDFASCEGCELQIANLEENVIDLVEAVDIVSFREVMKEHSDDYDIAFIEGSIQRPMDVERIKKIRANAKVLVALGDCACTGCVNKLRGDWPLKEPMMEVYGTAKPGEKALFDIKEAKALDEVVPVDFYIRGCPVRKEQVLYYIKRLSWMPLHTQHNSPFKVTEKHIPVDDRSLVVYNPHKCILCRRCDAVCRDALGIDALGMVGKGPETVVATPRNIGFDSNGCIRCGQCISACSCGSLEAKSTVNKLIAELKAGKALDIAVDSVILASFAERGHFLKDMKPAELERHVVGALRAAGFKHVIQYDHYLMESLKKDAQAKGGGKPAMLSWCKGAFEYAKTRVPDGQMEKFESRAPWSLLLGEHKGGNVCLLSPCTALKGVEGFAHALSAMELDELFKLLEIDIEFCKPSAYDGAVAKIGAGHPGYGPVKLGGSGVHSIRISRGTNNKLKDVRSGHVDLFPCLDRCLNGGGCYPTTEKAVIAARKKWLEALWEVGQ